MAQAEQSGADGAGAAGEWRHDAALPAASMPFGRRIALCAEAVATALRATFEEELAERRAFLCLPVLFGAGILAYFALPREPLLLPLLAAAILAAFGAWRAWLRGAPFRLLAVFAIVLAGATAAKLRVEAVETPRIERPMTAEVEGRVRSVDLRAERSPRLVLDRLRIGDLAASATPERVRIVVRGNLPSPGDRIALKARLMPLPGPELPGGLDARRGAFFESTGATGFALGRWRPAADAEAAPRFDPLVWIAVMRRAVAARIMEAARGEAGAVAAALLVGERGGISERTTEHLRDSGLAHILSISGLHMALIAGSAFFAVCGLLALVPRLALTQPIHKWAALATLLVATAYLALSGGDVATVQSYVMTAVMFVAVLLDRPALALRNVALAALFILALEPESIAEPGFLMSFSAVTALIAAWEAWRERQLLRLSDSARGVVSAVLARGAAALGAVALTTLVASTATTPFSIYFFHCAACQVQENILFSATD